MPQFSSRKPSTSQYLALKVRAAMASASARNPNMRAPWVNAPVWAGNTNYNLKAGYAVKNGGNRYILHTSSGNSAASGGPTGTGAGPITDGGAVWYYDGPDVAQQSETPAPTVTVATKPGGLTKKVNYNDAGAFFYTGGTPSYTAFGYRFAAANRAPGTGNAIGTYDQTNAPISFESDAPLIWINGGGTVYTGTNGTPYVIEVDGRWLKYGLITNLTDTASAGVAIDWGGQRKMRKYRVWTANNQSWYGVDVDPASVVSATKNPNRFRVVVNGDSLTAGANGFPVMGRNWVDTFGYLIGCDDYYNVAVGGTGYINNQGGTTTTFAGRLADVLGFAPDVHIVAGLYNDASYTSAARQAAILSYCQTFRASSAARLFVFGTASETNGTAFTTVDADIVAAVASLGDPNVIYFPVAADTPAWITGSGNVGATSGSGNADVYVQPAPQPPHFIQAGIDYVASRYAAAWSNYWAAQN